MFPVPFFDRTMPCYAEMCAMLMMLIRYKYLDKMKWKLPKFGPCMQVCCRFFSLFSSILATTLVVGFLVDRVDFIVLLSSCVDLTVLLRNCVDFVFVLLVNCVDLLVLGLLLAVSSFLESILTMLSRGCISMERRQDMIVDATEGHDGGGRRARSNDLLRRLLGAAQRSFSVLGLLLQGLLLASQRLLSLVDGALHRTVCPSSWGEEEY